MHCDEQKKEREREEMKSLLPRVCIPPSSSSISLYTREKSFFLWCIYTFMSIDYHLCSPWLKWFILVGEKFFFISKNIFLSFCRRDDFMGSMFVCLSLLRLSVNHNSSLKFESEICQIQKISKRLLFLKLTYRRRES